MIDLKPFSGSTAKQVNHHMIPTLEERQCDRATIHVRINDLLKGNLNVSPDRICNDILEIALLCRNYNIGKKFI